MCAEMYHRADFIQSDPVQFPHRYTLKQDLEVSGLLTAIVLPVGEGFSFRSNQ